MEEQKNNDDDDADPLVLSNISDYFCIYFVKIIFVDFFIFRMF